MSHHVHDMKPDRLPKPTVYKCSSCEFRCTPGALGVVQRSSNVHVMIKATDPRAKQIWSGR